LYVIGGIKSRRIRWPGDVACMGEMRFAYIILVRKPVGKRPLRRLRCRWEDNIRNGVKSYGLDSSLSGSISLVGVS
jgi:hypothetical protein